MTEPSSTQSDVSLPGATGSARRPWVFALAVSALLLVSGLGFRMGGSSGGGLINLTPPRVPLTEFPEEFLGYRWSKDRVLDPDTERVLGAMAYINRDGFRERDKSVASLWVSYYGESKTDLEHEPEVCMKAGGWTLPEGQSSAVIPMPVTKEFPESELKVGVYVFEKDVDHLLLVNTYCVNRRYTDSRDEARLWGQKGKGFYAQARVTIRLSDYEWAGFKLAGGAAGIYKNARDAQWVARGLSKLQRTEGQATSDERDPFLRAAEIIRQVVPELDRYYPPAETPSGPAGP